MTPTARHEYELHPQRTNLPAINSVPAMADRRPHSTEQSPGDDMQHSKHDAMDGRERIMDLDKEEYPSKPVLGILTIALMTAIFMVGLDTNIIGMCHAFDCSC